LAAALSDVAAGQATEMTAASGWRNRFVKHATTLPRYAVDLLRLERDFFQLAENENFKIGN